MSDKKQAIQKTNDERSVEFVPLGASDKVRLTAAMVKQFIAIPTKSGVLPSERDCIRFLMLCRGKRANPFEGDCWILGYDTQAGPSFSLVCGVDLFQKRAEVEKDYDGCESGVIVARDDVVVEKPGSFYIPDKETLLGGWARVYRKERGHSEYVTVKLSVYNTDLSRWKKDPAGMIEKVARSQALRKAFPTALGGLYVQEEMERVTQSGEGLMEVREPIAMPKEKATASDHEEIAPEAINENFRCADVGVDILPLTHRAKVAGSLEALGGLTDSATAIQREQVLAEDNPYWRSFVETCRLRQNELSPTDKAEEPAPPFSAKKQRRLANMEE